MYMNRWFSGYYYGDEASGLEDRNINYLHLGRDTFQVTPENSHLPDETYDYRGHQWRLWNTDDGTPTAFKMYFHHFDPHNHDEQSRQQYNRAGTQKEISLGRVFEEDYEHFDLIARKSRGAAPFQLVDRDFHFITVAEGAEVDRNPRGPRRRRAVPQATIAPFPPTLDGKSPAPDPVQREAMPPDTTPRSRMISQGETRLATRLESLATTGRTYAPYDTPKFYCTHCQGRRNKRNLPAVQYPDIKDTHLQTLTAS